MVSHTVFIWFSTLMTGGVAGSWLIVDTIRLRRAIADRAEIPVIRRDRIFGSVIGLAVALVGVVGAVAYHV